MIIRDKYSRLILWGYLEKTDKTEVIGQLAFIAENVYSPNFELLNGLIVEIPEQYLASDYPHAVNNLRLPVVGRTQKN